MSDIETPPAVLAAFGIAALNEMQEAAKAAILENPEVFLLSPTGSGKTLAFLLPVLSLMQTEARGVQCLVVVPTRELALQIEQVWRKMATGYKVTCCYGGHDMPTEIRSLQEAPALLIGTPGRILDHIFRKSFTAKTISMLVLDEFDKSLQLGFQEEMTEILGNLPHLKKKVLVSATAGSQLPDFTRLTAPVTLDFIRSSRQVKGLSLRLVETGKDGKPEKLVQLLRFLGSDSALIFCNLRDTVALIGSTLTAAGIECAVFHGKMEQPDRERALIRFRNGSVSHLVATDLAARGLDIPDMKHVIHYELPMKPDEFTHRNGRTARMQSEGTAYILFSETDKLPGFIRENTQRLELPWQLPLPVTPDWTTLYISGGKKNKLSKMDIVGFLLQKGKLDKQDLGLIEVKDTASFVAVKRDQAAALLLRIADEKMKGKKYKIERASL